jgi:predicted secreted protein
MVQPMLHHSRHLGYPCCLFLLSSQTAEVVSLFNVLLEQKDLKNVPSHRQKFWPYYQLLWLSRMFVVLLSARATNDDHDGALMTMTMLPATCNSATIQQWILRTIRTANDINHYNQSFSAQAGCTKQRRLRKRLQQRQQKLSFPNTPFLLRCITTTNTTNTAPVLLRWYLKTIMTWLIVDFSIFYM